jgi:hypothetical protein
MDYKDLIPDYGPESFLAEPNDQNLADGFHQRLTEWINDFHLSLDEEHEAGIRLVNFGTAVTFHIEDLGYWNPSLISFKGRNEQGERVTLIQHVSQISVLLVALKRKNIEAPKKPIGFASWSEHDDSK